MSEKICRTETLQSSTDFNPQLPFPLEDSRIREQPIHPQGLRGKLPGLDEVHSSNGWQGVTPRQGVEEDEEIHLILVVEPIAKLHGWPCFLAPVLQRTYRVEDPAKVQVVCLPNGLRAWW